MEIGLGLGMRTGGGGSALACGVVAAGSLGEAWIGCLRTDGGVGRWVWERMEAVATDKGLGED